MCPDTITFHCGLKHTGGHVARCGNMDKTCSMVFDGSQSLDVVSWIAMITRYAQGGNFRLAGQCLKDMLQKIYSHLMAYLEVFRLLVLSRKVIIFFKLMVEEHGIVPTLEHYKIIDLLGCAGHLNEAIALLESMPMPLDVIMWTFVLTSCRTYHNVELENGVLMNLFNWILMVLLHMSCCQILMLMLAWGMVLKPSISSINDVWVLLMMPGRASWLSFTAASRSSL